MSQVRRDPPFGIATTSDRHLIFKTPGVALTTADLSPGESAFALDSANNKLYVQVRYPDGTLYCAYVGTLAS